MDVAWRWFERSLLVLAVTLALVGGVWSCGWWFLGLCALASVAGYAGVWGLYKVRG
jgi:hypothetical protein